MLILVMGSSGVALAGTDKNVVRALTYASSCTLKTLSKMHIKCRLACCLMRCFNHLSVSFSLKREFSYLEEAESLISDKNSLGESET